jgi:hypothetical protein
MKDFTLPMGSLGRDRQNSGDIGRVEAIAREPQGDINLRQLIKARHRGFRLPRRDHPDGAVLSSGNAVGAAESRSSFELVKGVRQIPSQNAEPFGDSSRRISRIAP